MKIVTIEYVDYGVYGEYGFFGKIVGRTRGVETMTAEEREHEIAQMRAMLGDHVVAREVIEVPAV